MGIDAEQLVTSTLSGAVSGGLVSVLFGKRSAVIAQRREKRNELLQMVADLADRLPSSSISADFARSEAGRLEREARAIAGWDVRQAKKLERRVLLSSERDRPAVMKIELARFERYVLRRLTTLMSLRRAGHWIRDSWELRD